MPTISPAICVPVSPLQNKEIIREVFCYGEQDRQDLIFEKPEILPEQDTSWKEQFYFQAGFTWRRFLVSIIPGHDWFNQINPKDIGGKEVYLGALPDDLEKRHIPENSYFVSVVRNFEANRMDSRIRNSRDRCVINALDNHGMEPQAIERAMQTLKRALDLDRPVYLHCKSGVGRSATVLAALLIRYHGKTMQEAIDIVQRNRPDVHLKGKHRGAIMSWLNTPRAQLQS